MERFRRFQLNENGRNFRLNNEKVQVRFWTSANTCCMIMFACKFSQDISAEWHKSAYEQHLRETQKAESQNYTKVQSQMLITSFEMTNHEMHPMKFFYNFAIFCESIRY